MEVVSCAICVSTLRPEIEKKDIPGKSVEAISWARKQGVNISKFSLAKHRANHRGKSEGDKVLIGTDEGTSDQKSELTPVKDPDMPKDTKGPAKKRGVSRKTFPPKALVPEQKAEANSIDILPAANLSLSPVAAVSDTLFLDTIRDMVYQKLLAGEMELKLESGFKAIEIKNKIAEESQNEKLLLEILNEIRSEELAK